MSRWVTVVVAVVAALLVGNSQAFVSPKVATKRASPKTAAFVFGGNKKEPEEPQRFTREDMARLNAQSEANMQKDFQAMTVVSLIFSLPLLYLCWVAFFSD
mmetsp:Transcript_24006/g.56006  ORF Transcript_24006/g.56006 Transcript_24006/m.56006 type:complete len:101 (+) Transcript_24006:21-323(+)